MAYKRDVIILRLYQLHMKLQRTIFKKTANENRRGTFIKNTIVLL